MGRDAWQVHAGDRRLGLMVKHGDLDWRAYDPSMKQIGEGSSLEEVARKFLES